MWCAPIVRTSYSNGELYLKLTVLQFLHHIFRCVFQWVSKVDGDAATDIKDLEKVYTRLRETEVPGLGIFDLSSRPVGMAVGSR
jgi:hypothetical protein